DHFHEVLNVHKSIHPLSGSPTLSSDPVVVSLSPSLTPFGDSDFLLEETDAFLALDDSIPPEIDNGIYDSKGDVLFLEKLLNGDSTKDLPLKDLKNYETKMTKSSIEEPPEIELKDLPPYLEYAFLEGTSKLPGFGTDDRTEARSATPITSTTTPTMFGDDETIAQGRPEEERKRLAEEEATKTALLDEYDFIQVRIEADRLLALRLQDEEREQFIVEERGKHDGNKKPLRHKEEQNLRRNTSFVGESERGTLEIVINGEEKLSLLYRNKVSSPEWRLSIIYRANRTSGQSLSDREGFELILWGDLKIMMESSTEENDQSDFWSNKQDWKIIT
ncbi:hypothetical protein Tco_1149343, partial [Tanacetum coccineum]